MADFSDILKTVAPGLATALLGPLGGLAVSAIGKALDMPEATQDAIQARLQGASQDDLLKLKQADQQFAKDMKALDVDLERIAAGDRDSARKREMATNDKTPALLAGGVTLGFFGVLGYMLVCGKPPTGGDALLVMLGSLGTAWTAIISYYYGSSSGSQKKDATISKLAG